jgi:GT2 family glycosyltransferase
VKGNGKTRATSTTGSRLSPADYRRLKRRLRRFATSALPEDARVAVISRGDDQLLDLPGLRADHFPSSPGGGYAGFYPADGTSAIAHLEWVRATGADFLLFPETAAWWFDSFPRLTRHLEGHHALVAREPGVGTLYRLGPRAGHGANGTWMVGLSELLARWEEDTGSPTALLDWDTGRELASRLPERTVFSPPTSSPDLPYHDGSVDVVALIDDDPRRLAEAHRVARRCVVVFPERRGGSAPAAEAPAPVFEHVHGPPPGLPRVSVVIPTYNGAANLVPCVRGLEGSLPTDFDGEVVVVDDGSGPRTAHLLAELAERLPWLRVVRNRRNGGFISACNRGAREADGEYLVFLNDDTVPLPGWLPGLLRTFARLPDAGAVGGRLVYPDGSLQEAGGIIYRDGTGANVGRGDYEVDAPLYDFVRPVDYCSGALLATRASLFRSLGGFDRRYRPAYYEDTDYCFGVRDQGAKVYYQPRGTVVHTEGATSGTDPESGVKRHQARNRLTFVAKWANALDGHPEPPGSYSSLTWHRLALAGADR